MLSGDFTITITIIMVTKITKFLDRLVIKLFSTQEFLCSEKVFIGVTLIFTFWSTYLWVKKYMYYPFRENIIVIILVKTQLNHIHLASSMTVKKNGTRNFLSHKLAKPSQFMAQKLQILFLDILVECAKWMS